MSIKVAVVIPVYKEELNDLEKISLAQARKILGKYPFVFVAPEGKIFSYFESGDIVVQFPPQFFQSTKTYSISSTRSFSMTRWKSFARSATITLARLGR